MTVEELAKRIKGVVITSKDKSKDCIVSGMYICDMLSVAMARIEEGTAWVTILNNKNVIAVAVLREPACVIIAEDVELDETLTEKAEEENVIVIRTPLDSYSVAVNAGIIN